MSPKDFQVEILDFKLHLLEVDLLLVVFLSEHLLVRMRPLHIFFEHSDSLEDHFFL